MRLLGLGDWPADRGSLARAEGSEPIDRFVTALMYAMRQQLPGIRISERRPDALPGLDGLGGARRYEIGHPDLAGRAELTLAEGADGLDLVLRAWPPQGRRRVGNDARSGAPATAESATSLARWVTAYVEKAAASHARTPKARPARDPGEDVLTLL